jgi:hypothetical protein
MILLLGPLLKVEALRPLMFLTSTYTPEWGALHSVPVVRSFTRPLPGHPPPKTAGAAARSTLKVLVIGLIRNVTEIPGILARAARRGNHA